MWKRAWKCPRCGNFNTDYTCPKCGVSLKYTFLPWYAVFTVSVGNRLSNKSKSHGYLYQYFVDEDGCFWELRKIPKNHRERKKFIADENFRKKFYKKVQCPKKEK